MNSTVKKAGVVFLAIMMSSLFVGRAVDAAGPEEITVSAAISLKNAFEEIGRNFEVSGKDVKVRFNFGASGDLMAQIKGGAPVDVFASAAARDMDNLMKEGLALPETKTDFASNSLALVIPASSTLSIASFGDLAKPEIKKIAVGNPKTVPAGRYAEDVFQYFKISEKLNDRRILAENVRQVLDYTARGEVDAGVVYVTDAMTRQQEVKVVATAPETSHAPILYPIAVVKGSAHEQTARIFVAFVLSEDGQKVLKAHGFKPPRN